MIAHGRIMIFFESTGDSSLWQSGLFDNKSFSEIMAGWAPTVVCGRARFVEQFCQTGRNLLSV